MENNKRLFEDIDLPEAEGLTEVQFKELEKKVKKFLNAEELSKFNALSPDDLELYLLGFYNNVIEWKNAKYSANLPNNDGEDNDGEGGGQKENDGLDHWRPVKPQKNKKDLQDLEEDTDNKVYPDIKDDLDQSEEQSNKAEKEAENANKNQSNSRNPLDIADNAQSISNSAQDIADAAQLAAKAAQEAADQAEKNAQQSRSNSDIENADKSQMKADAAQKLADEATEAANRASDLADEARDVAAQGDAATAAQKTKEAYEATKEAAGKAKAARSNAKDALDASKKTDPNQKQGGLQGGQLSGLQSGQLSGSQSGSQSGLDGDESGSQSGLQGGQLGSASKGGKQKGQLTGQQGETEDNLPDPELDEAVDGFDPNGEFEHDEPLDIDLPFDGNDFFADDDEFRESCKEMAERAGQPLDSDDYITPEEYTGKKYQEALPKLSSWKPHSTPGTDGNPPTYLKDVMAKIFATNIDWRSKLEEFMTDKYPTKRNDVWAKRRMGLDPSHPFYIGRYLHPNVEYEEERSGLALIFFLVDASGSMGVRCGDGENIFTHIMSELIQIELSAKIKYSAYASFNTGPIMRDNIITWTYQDAMDELTLLEKFELPVAGGGTSAIDGIKSIQYYDDVYSTQDPWTLLVVVTDGGDNYNGLSDIVEDPDQIDNMIWIITATSDQWFEAKRKELMKLGIPEDRVICIDIDKEWGVSEKMVKR